MSKNTKLAMVISIIALAAASRLVKHPFNFTPIVGMAIFAGFYLRRYWAILLPLTAMAISDYFIGFYDWPVMLAVYFSIAVAFLVGWVLVKHYRWYNVALSAILSSLVFFVITNFSVWAFFSWYPHTWQGLAECFTLALPFFRNSLAGDMVYAGAFFGAYELVVFLAEKKVVLAETNSIK